MNHPVPAPDPQPSARKLPQWKLPQWKLPQWKLPQWKLPQWPWLLLALALLLGLVAGGVWWYFDAQIQRLGQPP